jgi:hypothetical protein
VREQHRELVTAEAGDQRAGTAVQQLGEAFGHFDEQGVAAGVAVGVVDALEVVQINEQDRQLRRSLDPGCGGS